MFSSLHTWGWITVIWEWSSSAVASSLLAGNTFGRVIGLVAASLGAIGALLAVGGAFPFWSLGIFALCVICIHGLVVYGEEEPGQRV